MLTESKMSFLLWLDPNPLQRASRGWQTGFFQLRWWICLSSLIVQKHTTTGSRRSFILWMFPGQMVILKAVTTKPRSSRGYPTVCVILIISEKEFYSVIRKNRVGAIAPTRSESFLFWLYPNYWHRTEKQLSSWAERQRSRRIYAFRLYLQSNWCQDPSTRFARSGWQLLLFPFGCTF